MAEQTDSSSDKQTGGDAREVADVGRSSAASRLSQPPGRRTGRRRRPPAWAVSLAARIAALQQFFRTRLPALLKNRRREISTVLISFAVHLLIGLLFAAWMMPDVATDGVLRLLGVADDPSEDLQADDIPQIVQPDSMQDLQVDSTMKQMLSELDRGTQRMNLNSPRPEDLTLPVDDLQDLSEIPVMRGEFGGRSEAGRRAAVKKFGGSADSERAVNAGLTWLQKVQKQDGSWSFDEVGGAGQGGTLQATPMGATSLALLTFLGGGHTHEIKGEYQETVTRGLNWLLSKAETTSSGLDLRGTAQGNSGLYVQGIATICLCEAAALAPKDRTLKRAATSAIRFVERSQDRLGGGWRYTPNQPGDTSVTGWRRKWGSLRLYAPRWPHRYHDSRRTALPDVHGLATGPPGTAGRCAAPGNCRPQPGKHVLQLLRDPGAASLGRGTVGTMEPEDARTAGHNPAAERPRRRQLGCDRSPWQWGRTNLSDCPQRADTGSLLQAPAHVPQTG